MHPVTPDLRQTPDAVIVAHAARDVQHQHCPLPAWFDQREDRRRRGRQVGGRVLAVTEIPMVPQHLRVHAIHEGVHKHDDLGI